MCSLASSWGDPGEAPGHKAGTATHCHGCRAADKAPSIFLDPFFFRSESDLSGTLGPGAGTGRVLTTWKSCLLMSPNNTASQIPSSLSKPFAVIRSFLALSRGLLAAAASQEMQRLSSDTALACPGSRNVLPFWTCSRSLACLASSTGHPGPPEGRSPSDVGTIGQLLLKYLHSGRIFSSTGCFWRLSPATYWIFSENFSPGKRPFNFSHSWKAAAQDLTEGSDTFCLGASGVASSAAASWATKYLWRFFTGMRRSLLVCGLIHTGPAGRGWEKERLILAGGDAHSSSS